MRVTIFCSGYVGLATGVCVADAGYHVVCIDADAGKIERLNWGEIPIHERGLDGLLREMPKPVALGEDIEKVRVGIGSYPRIGYSFICPASGGWWARGHRPQARSWRILQSRVARPP
jgi:UDP-glucose 6-dehydrogenase